MAERSQIKRRLSRPDSIGRIRQLIATNPEMHRTQLAERLCDELGFLDPGGRRQRSGCLKALRELEAKEFFRLPPPRKRPGPAQPRRLDQGVPEPQGVPGRVDELQSLELVLVETEEQMRIWNELFIEEHPRRAGPLVGRQLRYLIRSEHGWLGGLGFASAALHLGDRDRWIGWDLETRRAQLDCVVGMSRFLIRPSVRCQNLASRVLSLTMKRFLKDFEACYQYQPWLVETFVDTSSCRGTCYQAANWIRVGSSRGRNEDSPEESAEAVKDVYVYVLAEDFRDRMGLPAHSGLDALPLDAQLEANNWAQNEFGGAPLGDQRLTNRLVQSATVQAENPMSSFSEAAQGDNALVKGHYRLIDQPDDSAVTMENILLPHREQTIRRMKAHQTVLCIQDGTDLDYNGASECEGLGVIGTNQTGAKSRGLHLHSTLAVTEEGLPLGVLQGQCSAPVPRPEEDKRSAREIPIEEKKNYCWILGLRDCVELAAEMPHTRIVSVMDREADFFELFDYWRQNPSIDLLVRAQYNRHTTEDSKLFDGVRATEPHGRVSLHIGRQSARPKKSKQKARPQRKQRTAEVALRYQRVELSPPRGNNEPIPLWIVHVAEEAPPAGVEPVEWFLLTTVEITTPEQAERVVAWYCLRWRIEDWHRVLKTGCRIEGLRNETAERLKRALAIYMVIAWRVMLMTLLGREMPDLPPEVFFSDIELEVLGALAESRRDLRPPTRLKDAVHLVARLGGYLGRKSDPPPGHQVMWHGFFQLHILVQGYMLGVGRAGADSS